ncbi:MAG: GNAT family N-acetyltransferase [bacterium]
MDVDIRTASAADVGLLQQWALREGWGAGVGDIEAFRRADPEGFLLAWLGDRPVGSISAVRYDDSYAFIGYYIVEPDLRGRGIGHALFDAALAHVGPRSCGLDGVAAQLPTYESLGFAPVYAMTRFTGSTSIASATLAGEALYVVPATPDDVEALVDYDATHVPARRDAFVRAWLDPGSPRRTFAVRRRGAVAGYAIVRPAEGGGSRIGPLFADDLAAARALLGATAVAALVWGDGIAIDVPRPHSQAVQLMESLGFAGGYTCTRMYRGPVRALPLDRIWGNTTFELG